ncbi:peptidyl-tRNA hydrolase [bacterium BMS3Bbin06]|nr:peptidyl-tRNA hydrolase [bacterium BMS3Abin08]GBE34171.1 peptidyl-tRNA hydrolase [bacterium BMS3Bbin06]HDO36609.1 aminoacyl-tRNA hydrolase [Nitrospirota bacterium]HDY72350.1 aminoacyl-tRNA hydrolase [Nitrospirota bacterium]
MWLIVGLGNPGRKYHNTRHNIGFDVLENLAGELRLTPKIHDLYEYFEGVYEDNRLILLKPLTFMNLSGSAVSAIYRKKPVIPQQTIVIHDDLDLPVGKIKIRKKGSSGGHRGVRSIMESIGSSEFIRLKIGIGRAVDVPPEVYVLKKFTPDERETIRSSIQTASEAVLDIISTGVDAAMNRYNNSQQI